MSDWQPLETAPKDGSAILVVEFDSIDLHPFQYVARWSEREGCWDVVWEDKPVPYFWQPLPEPPSIARA